MSNKNLIKQYVGTGAILPEYQVNKLPSNNIKTYLRRRLQQSDDNSRKYYLRDYEIVKLPDDSRSKYISNLDDIFYLINDSKEPDRVINILLNNEEFISNLDTTKIKIIFTHSKEPEKVMVMTGEKGKVLLSRLDSYELDSLLKNSKEPQRLINILIGNDELILKLGLLKTLLIRSEEREKNINTLLNNKYFISNMKGPIITPFIENSKEPEKVVSVLLNNNAFVSNMNAYGLSEFLQVTQRALKEPETVITSLLNNKGFIPDYHKIYWLLKYSKEPEKVVDMLGDKGNEFINDAELKTINSLFNKAKEPEKIINVLLNNKEYISKLDSSGVNRMINYSKEPEKVKRVLRKYGYEV